MINNEPICVHMTVSESEQKFSMSVAEQTSVYSVEVSAPFIVSPIPSNYGLITWNGTYLMIS